MSFKNPESFHNKLGFVFHAMLALPLAAFVYLFLEIRHRELEAALDDVFVIQVLTYVLPIVAAIIMAWGYLQFKKQLPLVNDTKNFNQRLVMYYQATIRFYILIFVSSIIIVGGLYLTSGAIFILGYVLLLFLMSLNRPTQQKYVTDMRLSSAERDALLNKGTFEDAERVDEETK